MQTLIDALREVLGTPNFYLSNGSLDIGACLEYSVCAILLLVVVSSLFKILRSWICK